ncbi:MAG TPA: riboflavin synthase [Casimicrobiaceae bacterium]|nr:riboflavin synthase [Casimicrobiaceae bacterium]
MFTGIVQAVGRIVAVEPRSEGVQVAVDAGAFAEKDIAMGDSIALNGCCLTVVALDAGTMRFDVSSETLSCTTGLDGVGAVNLEKALRFSDRLGGHLMSGHVDGVGVVQRAEPVAEGGSVLLEVAVPSGLARFVAPKGSIAIDGVSLTVNAVHGRHFSVNLIPHTLAVTSLGALRAGARVNLEVDLIARYVERLSRAD